VVLDTLGELGSLYTLADLVFAGGTLAPVGGHNLVEPVQAGRVVVHGPHIENQRSQARLLEPLGVLRPIDGAAQLTETLLALWADPQRNLPAARAGKSLEAHRGATARALELLLELRSRKLDA
jgi:3-deoxy-D-manno-octulosonic-acid transferase